MQFVHFAREANGKTSGCLVKNNAFKWKNLHIFPAADAFFHFFMSIDIDSACWKWNALHIRDDDDDNDGSCWFITHFFSQVTIWRSSLTNYSAFKWNAIGIFSASFYLACIVKSASIFPSFIIHMALMHTHTHCSHHFVERIVCGMGKISRERDR